MDPEIAKFRIELFLEDLIRMSNGEEIKSAKIKPVPTYSWFIISSLQKILDGENPSKAFGLVKSNHRPNTTKDRDIQIACDYASLCAEGMTPKAAKYQLTEEWNLGFESIKNICKKFKTEGKNKYNWYQQLKINDPGCYEMFQEYRLYILENHLGKKV